MFWRKRRYVVAIMGFFGFFSMYTLQSNLNIAILAMTENKTIVLDNNTVVYVSLDNLKKLQILNHCLEARI
jgi:ACS family sodium-dependent inorganic phosphate cotransporter